MANFRKLKKSELASAAIMACQSTLPILTDSITHHVYHVLSMEARNVVAGNMV